jgi:Na+/H+ antiporter NhaD/arsenite permease-like protein
MVMHCSEERADEGDGGKGDEEDDGRVHGRCLQTGGPLGPCVTNHHTLVSKVAREKGDSLRSSSMGPRTRRILRLVMEVGISLGVAMVMLAPVAGAALVAGAAAMLASGGASMAVLRRVGWSLLGLFAGLFVVVGALGETGVTAAALAVLAGDGVLAVVPLTALTAVLSNIVSNVPAVLLVVPFLLQLGGGASELLVVAVASTLAGNLTLVGSIANLILAESARRDGVHVGFGAYLMVGAPITLLSLIAGVAWLSR